MSVPASSALFLTILEWQVLRELPDSPITWQEQVIDREGRTIHTRQDAGTPDQAIDRCRTDPPTATPPASLSPREANPLSPGLPNPAIEASLPSCIHVGVTAPLLVGRPVQLQLLSAHRISAGALHFERLPCRAWPNQP
jgi:hypothetical protein